MRCFEFQYRGLTIQVLWTGTSNAQSVRHERAFAALKCPSKSWSESLTTVAKVPNCCLRPEFAWQEFNVPQDSANIWHLWWQPRSDVDTTVVTWGDREWGGDSSKVQQRLKKGATQALNISWSVIGCVADPKVEVTKGRVIPCMLRCLNVFIMCLN